MNKLIWFFSFCLIISSCSNDGCTDPNSFNYDSSANKDDGSCRYLATITSASITGITNSSAISGGEISSDGGSFVSLRGVCWSTNPTPTISNDTTINGSGTGSFTSEINGIQTGTTYYLRAYATNSDGTSYGNETSFTTLGLPQVSTTTVYAISYDYAISGGNVTSDGGSDIIQKGVCWSTSSNPTIADDFTTDGIGTGVYTSDLNGLTVNTIYYVRAYAENDYGISYGDDVTFTTKGYSTPGSGVTDIDGNTYTTLIFSNGQEWMGENLRTTKYANGDVISNITSGGQWNTTSGAWCYYNNDSQFDATYGKLYNWYAASDSRNVCPSGWHLPSEYQFESLVYLLGDWASAGGNMKSTGTQFWSSPNTGATNYSGFSGLPGGFRESNGSFSNEGNSGLWWTAHSSSTVLAKYRNLIYNSIEARQYQGNKNSGFSVRCVKD